MCVGVCVCVCVCEVFLCGAGTAYIHGIKHATGNFIILMDADLSHHVCLCVLVYVMPVYSIGHVMHTCNTAQVHTGVHQVSVCFPLLVE